MRDGLKFGVPFIFALALLVGSVPQASAGESCSQELRRDIDFLLQPQQRSKSEGLALTISLLGNAPASAKEKEKNSFCYYIREAAKTYEEVALQQLPQISRASNKELLITDAYINSAVQLTALKLEYCDNSKCDGGWLQPKNCTSEVIQERLGYLRADGPRIRELFRRLETKKRSCDQTSSNELDPQQSIQASSILDSQSAEDRRVAERAQSGRREILPQSGLNAVEAISASASDGR